MASTAISFPAGNHSSNERQMAPKRRKHQRRRAIERRMEKVRREMKEIREEQRKIREGQRAVQVKSKVVGLECKRLRFMTDAILKQSAMTQQRLGLMFGILRARENNDTATANQLAMRLRLVSSSPPFLQDLKKMNMIRSLF